MMAALAVGGAAGLVSMSAGSAQATEGGTDGLISTNTYPTTTVENADGSGLKTIGGVSNNTATVVRNVNWSADGSRMVWSNLAGSCGIFTSDPDLTSIVQVAGNGPSCYGTEPAFFDQDQQIVFQGPGVDLSTSQLYRTPILGAPGPQTSPYLLGTGDTGFNDAYPRVSGNLISFTRTARTSGAVPQVWIYDVTAGTASLAVDNAQDADISPDGKTLVFTRPGSQELFTSAIDGTGVTQLTTDGATVDHQTPVWSPSEKMIAFSDGKNSSVLDVATGVETMLAGSGIQPAGQPVNPSAPPPPSTPPSTLPTTTPTTPTTPPSTTPTTPPSTPPSTPASTPASTPPSSPPPTNPPPPRVPLVQRIAGTDRFDTGVKTSRLLWPGATGSAPIHAKAVVLATGASFPDALAGGPLARAAQGPLLLTDPGSLTAETFDEIRRVLPAGGTVYVLGGGSAVSPAVAAELTSHGYNVRRLGGTDRFATARLIADEVERLEPVPAGEHEAFVLATGQNFADALSAGPLAAVAGMPILLSDGATLDPATRAYLDGKDVLPVGGPAYQAAGFAPNPAEQCDDLAGTDRFSTSAAVARCIAEARARAGRPAAVFTGVATGMNYADALTGGAFLGMLGDPLLLTDPQSLSGPAAAFLASERQTVGIVEIFGGANAVWPGVESSILSLLGGRHLAPLVAPSGQPAPATGTAATLGFSTQPMSLPAVRAAALSAH